MPILFTTDRPGFYLLNQIYDPDTNLDGETIPRPGSMVLDEAEGLLQRVISVHEITNKPTYGPVLTSLIAPSPTIPVSNDNAIVSMIDYGNSRFVLWYSPHGSETPTKLNVDKKVIILGDDANEFEIVKWDQATDQLIPISLYFDTDGTFKGNRIPLVEISTTNKAKVPTNCHTSSVLNDDEVYYLIIYDYAGTQCGSVKLFAKQALINNVTGDDLIITAFNVNSSQQDSEGMYLFPDQDPNSLILNPEIVYSNGETRHIPIDNEICHLYGLEGFTAAYPGQQIDLLVKYFLTASQQAVTADLASVGNTRFLYKNIKLTVKNPGDNDHNVKLLVVPRYLRNQDKYILTFFMYSLERDTVRNVTQYVTVTPTFQGSNMNVEQELLLSYRIRDIFPDASNDLIYQQPVVIKLAPYSYYERYIIRDTLGDTYGVYGADSVILARPVLYYDSNIEKYFIPTSKFPNKDTLLEAFYYKARPLYDNSWLTSPETPTHFTIRDAVTGDVLVASPINVDGYTQSFNLTNVTNPAHLLGDNCIVEFLKDIGGTFKVLYGAPVDVYAGIFV